MNAPLTQAWLSERFAEVGEVFPDDVTALHVFLVEDVHFGDVEMEVALYGTTILPDVLDVPDVRGEPVVSERIDNPGDLLDVEGLLEGKGVPPAALRGLLDQQAWAALHPWLHRIEVSWNPGCHEPQPVPLDLGHPERCPALRPMVR